MTARPLRIQLKRTKGWRMPENTVKVDRTTKWGNPFRIGEAHIPNAHEAVRMFRARFIGPLATPMPRGSYLGVIAATIHELRGMNMACWCDLCPKHENGKPFGESCADCAPCHADVLLELANP